MTDAAPALSRLHAFWADERVTWETICEVLGDGDDHDRWDEAFSYAEVAAAQIANDHVWDDASVSLARSFSDDEPEYGEEDIITVTPGDTHTTVLTRSRRRSAQHLFYTLTARDGEWKIAAISGIYGDPDEPVFTKQVFNQAKKARPDAPLAPLNVRERVDGKRLFTDGTAWHPTLAMQLTRTTVTLGEFESTTGVLAAFDLSRNDAIPFARAVTPGRYRVDLLDTDDGMIAAFRVVVADGDPVAWHPADCVPGGHVVPTDAANLAVVDVAGLAGVTRMQQELMYKAWAGSPQPAATLVRFGDGPVIGGVVGSSRDGHFPAYWGVDANGEPVWLLIDFKNIGLDIEETITMPWQVGKTKIDHPNLPGVKVRIKQGKKKAVLTVDDEYTWVRRVRVLDKAGTVIADTDYNTYPFGELDVYGDPDGWVVELTVHVADEHI